MHIKLWFYGVSSENELPKGLGPSSQKEEAVECAKPNEIMGSTNSKRKAGSQRDGNSDAKNKTETEGKTSLNLYRLFIRKNLSKGTPDLK